MSSTHCIYAQREVWSPLEVAMGDPQSEMKCFQSLEQLWVPALHFSFTRLCKLSKKENFSCTQRVHFMSSIL